MPRRTCWTFQCRNCAATCTCPCLCCCRRGARCTSMSRAIRPAVRSAEHPEGLPDCRESVRERVHEGNLRASFFAAVVEAAVSAETLFWVENPAGSFLCLLDEWVALRQKRADVANFFLIDYCRCNIRWRKRTRFFTSTSLQGQRVPSNGKGRHQRLSGVFALDKAGGALPSPVEPHLGSGYG